MVLNQTWALSQRENNITKCSKHGPPLKNGFYELGPPLA